MELPNLINFWIALICLSTAVIQKDSRNRNINFVLGCVNLVIFIWG